MSNILEEYLVRIGAEIDRDAFVTEFETTSVYGGSTSDAYISDKTKAEVLRRAKVRKRR